MKITAEDYEMLKEACFAVLEDHPTMPEIYREASLSPKRLRWDVLHGARINGERSL